MNWDSKLRPDSESEFFSDHRLERPMIPGTVARGHLQADATLSTGRVGDELTTVSPVSVTIALMQRGQQRYDIYCATCHGRLGDGDGMIVRRGFSRPKSFHDDTLLTAPVGHIFDSMTRGFGRMASYSTQLSVHDRWAIAVYVKALQFSQHAGVDDVSGPEREKLASDGPRR